MLLYPAYIRLYNRGTLQNIVGFKAAKSSISFILSCNFKWIRSHPWFKILKLKTVDADLTFLKLCFHLQDKKEKRVSSSVRNFLCVTLEIKAILQKDWRLEMNNYWTSYMQTNNSSLGHIIEWFIISNAKWEKDCESGSKRPPTHRQINYTQKESINKRNLLPIH